MSSSSIVVALLSLVLSPAWRAAESDPPGGAPEQSEPAGEAFVAAVEELRSGRLPADFSAFREGWTRHPSYNPYLHMNGDFLEGVNALGAALDREGASAIELCSDPEPAWWVDVRWNSLCEAAFSAAGRRERAALHAATARGLMRSIAASGDGSSAATAYRVVTILEEWAVLGARGLEMREQSLLGVEGRMVDRIVAASEEGEEVVLYFDVTPMWRWLDRSLSPDGS